MDSDCVSQQWFLLREGNIDLEYIRRAEELGPTLEDVNVGKEKEAWFARKDLAISPWVTFANSCECLWNISGLKSE